MVDRENEKAVYQALEILNITDSVVGFDTKTGMKISEFIDNSAIADPYNDKDLKLSMELLKKTHQSGIVSQNNYDIDKKIYKYIQLAEGENAIRFSDMPQTKEKLKRLLELKQQLDVAQVLCHGDYSHVNVLITSEGTGKIVDWEFAAMGDPIMDIAMYGIFAGFDKDRLEYSLEIYLGEKPSDTQLKRLYLYVALSGLQWCIWSQYRQGLGNEFGEYPLKMYRYMKDYYNLCGF